jgi:hypothetical protein
MRPWLDRAVWEAVGDELRGHRRRGLGALLTEDVVRFATIQALVEAGVVPRDLRVEAPHIALKGLRVDLVVNGRQQALIELKYPREPNLVNAAWTMTLGEILQDFYRLAAYPGDVDRIFVYVETGRLRTYMARSASRYGIDLDRTMVLLSPADAATLPATARQIVGIDLAAQPVTARRISLIVVDSDLRLAVYHVDQLPETISPVASVTVAPTPVAGVETSPLSATRTGAPAGRSCK